MLLFMYDFTNCESWKQIHMQLMNKNVYLHVNKPWLNIQYGKTQIKISIIGFPSLSKSRKHYMHSQKTAAVHSRWRVLHLCWGVSDGLTGAAWPQGKYNAKDTWSFAQLHGCSEAA